LRPFAPAAAAAVAGIQVGAAIAATRWVVGDVGVVPLALLRYAIGVACLAPFALAARSRVSAGDLLPIGLLGITQFAVVVVLLNYALETVPAARVALLFASAPLIAMVVEGAVERRRFEVTRLFAVLLTLAGVALAVGGGPLGGGSRAEWTGDAAALGSAACAAVCGVLYRPYLQRYGSIAVSALAMLASVIVLLGVAALTSWTMNAVVEASAWITVFAVGVSSAIGFYLWLWALARQPSTEVVMFLALSPVTAALLGVALLGESITAPVVIGLILVVGGLWLAQHSSRGRRGGAVRK
jgi:drug/metabolite transporter (DMT)-like permease